MVMWTSAVQKLGLRTRVSSLEGSIDPDMPKQQQDELRAQLESLGIPGTDLVFGGIHKQPLPMAARF